MAASGIPVSVEIIALAARDGALGYRVLRRPLPPGTEPDDVARASLDLSVDSDGLLHSTSWRYDDATLILTYVALPDPDPRAPRRQVAGPVARGDGPTEPSPDVELDEVAAHACRHLAFLAATDPEVSGALAGHPRIRRLVRGYAPDVAGELPDD